MDEEKGGSQIPAAEERPTMILIPPRSAEALFTGAKSPGPMTMLSNYLCDNFPVDGDFRSFSQLLAGAIASPSAGGGTLSFGGSNNNNNNNNSWSESSVKTEVSSDGKDVGGGAAGFRQSRPSSLMVPVSPLFSASPAFTPSAFLNSPGLFSPALSPFGMSHQQALAQVTAQAALSQAGCHAASSVAPPTDPLTSHQSSVCNDQQHLSVNDGALESAEACHSDRTISQNSSIVIDRPANDGYNWRKYGQKQVKGCEYPRSYYKCTVPSCPVRKKVEHSYEGCITEIIYKGQHNHEPPQQGRRCREGSSLNTLTMVQHGDSQWLNGAVAHSNLGGDEDSTQETSIQLHGLSDSEETGDANQRVEDDDKPNPKRINIGAGTSEVSLSYKTLAEPKIIVQTRSEVDLLDDGYKWRKYGQKVVKTNPNPRSYYKCTTAGCNVRKHIERSSTDPKAVITTYEGKHNHDIPAGRSSSIDTTQQAKSLNFVDFRSENGAQVSFLPLKEEKIVV
ncbi:hypothetical protein Nepgr_017529 [Nepenthes gracilis]|uniref:WRKY domain-containing protein n=1 Tax=Nepenthes gracilis TaxID=150966 RepID=A0AAD3XSJ9_NEPGR|nr:hypothetical protein Nepgr_017529 [Nepenthes gracilis]